MKIVGHRGAKGLAPENTLASIQAAIEVGVDEIEIDVRVTRDNQVVLNHDDFIEQSGKRYKISLHTLDELKAIKSDLTLFYDAASLVNQKVPLMVEVKPGVPTEPVVKILEQLMDQGWPASSISVGSFSQRTLLKLRHSAPMIKPVVITKSFGWFALMRAKKLNTRTVSLSHHLLTRYFIKRAVAKGYNVYAYTINNPVEVAKFETAGLAGVITDRPDLFKK